APAEPQDPYAQPGETFGGPQAQDPFAQSQADLPSQPAPQDPYAQQPEQEPCGRPPHEQSQDPFAPSSAGSASSASDPYGQPDPLRAATRAVPPAGPPRAAPGPPWSARRWGPELGLLGLGPLWPGEPRLRGAVTGLRSAAAELRPRWRRRPGTRGGVGTEPAGGGLAGDLPGSLRRPPFPAGLHHHRHHPGLHHRAQLRHAELGQRYLGPGRG